MCALLVLLATLLTVSAVSEQGQSDQHSSILRDTRNGNGLNDCMNVYKLTSCARSAVSQPASQPRVAKAWTHWFSDSVFSTSATRYPSECTYETE